MEAKRNTDFLETRPIGHLLLKFSAPAIAAAFISATYNFVARIFVGQKFGMIGITALTVSFPAMILMLALAMMVGTGASTLLSIQLGEKNIDRAERILGQALLMFFLLSVPFVVFSPFYLEWLLRIFGASDEVLLYAKPYLSIIIWGMPLQMISYGVNNFIRAEGRPNVAMFSMIIAALANMFFDWFFLFHLETGIWGAGAANLIALTISAVWVCWLYLSGRTVLRWRWKYFRPNFGLMKTIALFGLVPLTMQFSNAIIQYVQNYLFGYYGSLYEKTAEMSGIGGGDLAIGLFGAVMAVNALMVMPFLGLSQGLQPIVGYNVGAERPHRVLHSLRLALTVTVLFGSVFWLLVMLKPDWLLIPFIPKQSPGYEQFLKIGTYAMRIVFLVIPLVGINIVVSGYFQAHGRPKLSLILTLMRQLIVLLPALVLMPILFEKLFHGSGLSGIWFAFSLSDALTCGVTFFFLIREVRSKARQIKLQNSLAIPKS